MPSKVPPNYFIYPEFLAFVFLPITWVLLPVAGFQPNSLADYLPPDIFQSISKAQVSHSNDSHQCAVLAADFVIFYYGTENEERIQAGAGSE